MTREEFISKMKALKTDEEWLAFEQECYSTWTDEDREAIGAAAMPLGEKCAFIRREMKK